MMNKKIGTMYLPTQSAIALWECEFTGQLSDGMWENSRPYDHYKFWFQLDVKLGPEPMVNVPQYTYCRKNQYAFGKLFPIIGDRMLKIGRMGQVTLDDKALRASQYMPATLIEWREKKAGGKWEYDFIATYMDAVTDEIAVSFYLARYTKKDFLDDVEAIKAAMLTVPKL